MYKVKNTQNTSTLFPMKNALSDGVINEIIPNLYLGNMWATTPAILSKYNIDCVLNVSNRATDMNHNKYKLHSHLVIEINDVPRASQQMLSEVLPKAMRYLDTFIHPEAPSHKRVLVHCAAGISRSATIVIAWLMKTYGINRNKAILFVRARRSIISPNDGFIAILGEWERYLKRFHRNTAITSRRATRGYNNQKITKHHLYANECNNHNNRNRHHDLQQFERQFRVMPNEFTEFQTTQHYAPSFSQEFDEKMYSNDDAFKHLY